MWKVRLKFLSTDDENKKDNEKDDNNDNAGAMAIVLETFIFWQTNKSIHKMPVHDKTYMYII